MQYYHLPYGASKKNIGEYISFQYRLFPENLTVSEQLNSQPQQEPDKIKEIFIVKFQCVWESNKEDTILGLHKNQDNHAFRFKKWSSYTTGREYRRE